MKSLYNALVIITLVLPMSSIIGGEFSGPASGRSDDESEVFSPLSEKTLSPYSDEHEPESVFNKDNIGRFGVAGGGESLPSPTYSQSSDLFSPSSALSIPSIASSRSPFDDTTQVLVDVQSTSVSLLKVLQDAARDNDDSSRMLRNAFKIELAASKKFTTIQHINNLRKRLEQEVLHCYAQQYRVNLKDIPPDVQQDIITIEQSALRAKMEQRLVKSPVVDTDLRAQERRQKAELLFSQHPIITNYIRFIGLNLGLPDTPPPGKTPLSSALDKEEAHYWLKQLKDYNQKVLTGINVCAVTQAMNTYIYNVDRALDLCTRASRSKKKVVKKKKRNRATQVAQSPTEE